MSSEKGRTFPKKGKRLHHLERGQPSYEALVASALRRELGGSRRAVKTLEKWTGASPRTAKNWLSGSTGPSGEHLMLLLGFSDEVFGAILSRVNRNRSITTERIAGARLLLADAISLLNG
jgi:hypothetical protein